MQPSFRFIFMLVVTVLLAQCSGISPQHSRSKFSNTRLPWQDVSPLLIEPSQEQMPAFRRHLTDDFFQTQKDDYFPDIKPRNSNQNVVALLLPLSGHGYRTGESILNAAEIAAFDKADKDFVLLPFDTKGTVIGAKNAAQEAIDANASIIIGPLFSEAVKAVTPIAYDADIPMIAFSNNSSVAAPNTFLMGFLPEHEVLRSLDYAYKNERKRLALLLPDNDYGKLIRDTALRFAAQYEDFNITDITFFSENVRDFSKSVKKLTHYDERQTIYQGVLDDIKQNLFDAGFVEPEKMDEVKLKFKLSEIDTGFDAVLIPASGLKLKQIAPLFSYYEVDVKDKVKLLGTTLWNEKTLGQEEALRMGWYAGSPFSDSKKRFEIRFKKMFKKSPSRVASIGYDAVSLAATMARKNIPFSTYALTAFQGFQGIDGFFHFNEDGTNQRGLAMYEVRRRYHKIIDSPTLQSTAELPELDEATITELIETQINQPLQERIEIVQPTLEELFMATDDNIVIEEN